jgi:HNH endonuclease
MMSSNCALCKTLLMASNDSAEHVIANAIGGIWTVKGFICKRCNDTTGHSWDAELAAQLNGLCHFFAIKRDRGSIPAETITTTAGETFDMLSDGGFALRRPTVEKTKVGAHTQYRIVARDETEARQILEGLKRKFPDLDIEAQLATTKVETSFLQGLVKLPLEIGGVGAGRAMVKSAIALAHATKIPATVCNRALAYLRHPDAVPCFGYYQSTDLMVARPRGVPLHCVAISGNSGSGLLLGYVEYFGIHRAVILLSDAYSGPEINRCYAIDPTNAKELNLSVRLEFTLTEMNDIFYYKLCDHKDTLRAADEVLGPGMEQKRKREWRHAVKDAIRYGWDNCGANPDEVLTEEHRRTIFRLAMEKLHTYIENLGRPRPAPPGFTP